MTFFTLGAMYRLGPENKLLKLDKLIDWTQISITLRGIHKNEINSQGGPRAYNNLSMFKAILLGQWHNLSDPALEEALRVRLDFIIFTGLESPEEVPDETTLCRFRNALIQKKLDQVLFETINQQLEQLGLKIEKAQGAVIDATIIESAARPRRTIEAPAQDRKESTEEPSAYKMLESADPDAKWLIKGKKFYFGYKGFIETDTERGFINNVHVTAANRAECLELPFLLKDIKAKWLFADKGYASSENRQAVRNKQMRDGIMRKAVRGKALKFSEKLFNKLISKRRFIVEQGFGTLKRRFCFRRASYMSRLKIEAQFRFKAICFNLLKAINLVEFA